MGVLGFFLGILASFMVYWLFIKEKSQQKWSICVLAVILIVWTVFLVDFAITSLIEGMPQAAAVSVLLFGIIEIFLFVLLKRFSGVTKVENNVPLSGK
jgi:ABC-type transport system involved in cytochrome c biogenesis permease subunit